MYGARTSEALEGRSKGGDKGVGGRDWFDERSFTLRFEGWEGPSGGCAVGVI